MTIRLLFLLLGCVSLADMAAADVRIEENADQGVVITNLVEENTWPSATAQASASPSTLLPYNDAVEAAARATRLEPALLHAVIRAESRHDPKARSARGAQGLMQLMPATARCYGLANPYDPQQNIRAGAVYLRELYDQFQGDLPLTLAAYNAGPGAVLRYGKRVPPYGETQRYVPTVLKLYRELSGKPI